MFGKMMNLFWIDVPVTSYSRYFLRFSVTSSNEIESPNDHILFNNSQKMIYFRNVKTNERISRNVASFEFMRYVGRIYNIYD